MQSQHRSASVKHLQANRSFVITSLLELAWQRVLVVEADWTPRFWNTGTDSGWGRLLGAERAAALRTFLKRPFALPLFGLSIQSSNILGLAALLDRAGDDDTSWHPFYMALAALLLGLPSRVYLVGECAVPILKLLLTDFDCILPVLLCTVSFFSLADCMRWQGRALALVPLFLTANLSIITDALPDHGRSKMAMVNMCTGAVTTLIIFASVFAGAVPGLVYRPLFDYGTVMARGDEYAVKVTNMELFRSCQSMLLTLLARVVLSRIRTPDDCIILKTGCIIREVSVDELVLSGVHQPCDSRVAIPAAYRTRLVEPIQDKDGVEVLGVVPSPLCTVQTDASPA